MFGFARRVFISPLLTFVCTKFFVYSGLVFSLAGTSYWSRLF